MYSIVGSGWGFDDGTGSVSAVHEEPVKESMMENKTLDKGRQSLAAGNKKRKSTKESEIERVTSI
jgi:hypothetical protein